MEFTDEARRSARNSRVSAPREDQHPLKILKREIGIVMVLPKIVQ
jgi:hypothetical protein